MELGQVRREFNNKAQEENDAEGNPGITPPKFSEFSSVKSWEENKDAERGGSSPFLTFPSSVIHYINQIIFHLKRMSSGP